MRKNRGIDLGQLQEQFETARAADKNAARALERAEQARDSAAARLADLTAALKTAARAVLV